MSFCPEGFCCHLFERLETAPGLGTSPLLHTATWLQKFKPFLSQAEQAGLAAPHPWLQDVPQLCFTHSQANIPPSPSPTRTQLHNFCWNFFFFIHPEVKKSSWNGKFQLKQILNVAKSQAHGNRTQKRGCWTSLTPHSTSGSTSKAYFDPLWNKTQFHKQELCKPLCIYYLQKPQPFNGSILPPIWIQLGIGTQSLWDNQKRKKWVSQDHCEHSPTSLHSEGHHQPT